MGGIEATSGRRGPTHSFKPASEWGGPGKAPEVLRERPTRGVRTSEAPGEIEKVRRAFLLQAHLSGDVIAELLLDLLLDLGIEVG